jgi:hypothetical protein
MATTFRGMKQSEIASKVQTGEIRSCAYESFGEYVKSMRQ